MASRPDNFYRYGLAALAAVAALLLRKLLMPVLGEQNPYHTAWAAVVFSAWYCGLGPSIVTVLLEVIGIWYWFLLPSPSIQLANPRAENSGMLGFLAFLGFIIALGEANRRSLSRAQLGEERVRKSHAELEQKVHERMAELRIANENLRELSGRLQQLRDEERRQIGRELHDSVGQMLAALSHEYWNNPDVGPKLDPAAARTVSDSAGLVEQISREIRTISYLLHPPLLEIAGLLSAMRWYVDGFSERSKIKVDLEIRSEPHRLSNEIELAIFRVVPECLTNIHRHSGGTGVGFRGMRERLRQFNGDLDIQSGASGTCVTASIPLPESKT